MNQKAMSSKRKKNESGKKGKRSHQDSVKTATASNKETRSNIVASIPPKIIEPPFEWFKLKDGNEDENGFQAVLNLLKSKKRILVLCGAGMSVSCGIPDFRSKDGLYATLNVEELGLHSAEDLFDIEVFQDNPAPFYKFAQRHFVSSARKEIRPSISHIFLSLLNKNKQLLRVYTQNIDGLEEVAGLPSNKVVYAHGSLGWAQCMTCKKKADSTVIAMDMEHGRVPRCQNIARKKASLSRTASKDSLNSTTNSSSDATSFSGSVTSIEQRGKRQKRSCNKKSNPKNSISNENNPWESAMTPEDPSKCNGPMKPGITFFGEKLQCNVARLIETDRKKADALLVIGTSLSVAPMSNVIQYLCPSTPRILINRTYVKPPKSKSLDAEDTDCPVEKKDFRKDNLFDAYLLGDCDSVTGALAVGLKLPIGTEDSFQTKNEAAIVFTKPTSLKIGDSVTVRTNREVEERTFVFPGASLDEGCNDENEEEELCEVVHCDGCQHKIEEGHIMKCQDCFDFDLCSSCFPKVSRKHFKGAHKFRKES